MDPRLDLSSNFMTFTIANNVLSKVERFVSNQIEIAATDGVSLAKTEYGSTINRYGNDSWVVLLPGIREFRYFYFLFDSGTYFLSNSPR